jgi:plasmid stability protein
VVSINLDDLDEETAVRLRARAVGNGCSIEEEALNVLRLALDKPGALPQPKNHAAAIHELFKDLGFGVEVRPRSENPDPVVRYYWLDEDDGDNS